MSHPHPWYYGAGIPPYATIVGTDVSETGPGRVRDDRRPSRGEAYPVGPAQATVEPGRDVYAVGPTRASAEHSDFGYDFGVGPSTGPYRHPQPPTSVPPSNYPTPRPSAPPSNPHPTPTASTSRIPPAPAAEEEPVAEWARQPFRCDECEAGFSNRSNLNNHLNTSLAHTGGERKYQCDVCGARFTRRNDVRRHRKAHTGGTSSASHRRKS